MAMSPRMHRLESDGSLVVEVGTRPSLVLKYGPLAQGMPWAWLDDETWVVAERDYGADHELVIVDVADRRVADSPDGRYLAGIPAGDLDLLSQSVFLQATMLRLYARWPEARDLLRANPVLLRFVAFKHEVSPEERHCLPEMLRKSQRELLGWILDRPVRPAQVRFLKKLVLTSRDNQDLRVALACANREEFVASMEQWPKVPTHFLTLLLDEPVLAQLEWLRKEVAAVRTRADMSRVLQQRYRLLWDTVRILKSEHRTDIDETLDLRRCQSPASLQRLHDRLVAAQRVDWEKKLLESDNPRVRAFPEPPIPSDDCFQAITSVAGLIEEADAMQNCVVFRAGEAMRGISAIYRVQAAGQRGTLQISVGRNREPGSVEEFKLACNAEPSEAAWEAVRQWLDEGRQRWRERRGR